MIERGCSLNPATGRSSDPFLILLLLLSIILPVAPLFAQSASAGTSSSAASVGVCNPNPCANEEGRERCCSSDSLPAGYQCVPSDYSCCPGGPACAPDQSCCPGGGCANKKTSKCCPGGVICGQGQHCCGPDCVDSLDDCCESMFADLETTKIKIGDCSLKGLKCCPGDGCYNPGSRQCCEGQLCALSRYCCKGRGLAVPCVDSFRDCPRLDLAASSSSSSGGADIS